MFLLKMLSTRLVFYVCNTCLPNLVWENEQKQTKRSYHQCPATTAIPLLHSCYRPSSSPQDYVSFENAIHYWVRIEQLVGTCLSLVAIICCLMKAVEQGRGGRETVGWHPIVHHSTAKAGQKQGGPFRFSHHVLSCCMRCIHNQPTNQPIHSCLSWHSTPSVGICQHPKTHPLTGHSPKHWFIWWVKSVSNCYLQITHLLRVCFPSTKHN